MDIVDQIAAYFEDKDEVVAVYLFGSYASGKQRYNSDIDLGILFEINSRKKHYELIDKFISPLSRLVRRDLHVVPLNTASEALLKQVFKKGRCILVNNSNKLAKFKMTAFSKIADFGYYQQMIKDGFTKKLIET